MINCFPIVQQGKVLEDLQELTKNVATIALLLFHGPKTPIWTIILYLFFRFGERDRLRLRDRRDVLTFS